MKRLEILTSIKNGYWALFWRSILPVEQATALKAEIEKIEKQIEQATADDLERRGFFDTANVLREKLDKKWYGQLFLF